MVTENLSTKNIKEFTTNDTIYMRRTNEFNKPLYLCRFIGYEKGMVKGKAIYTDVNPELAKNDIEKGLILSNRLENCALYGRSAGSDRKFYHWFGSQGYAMHPDEVHKVLESGDLHVEKHPSFGIIRASRSSGYTRTLFGSSIKSGNTITIQISRCEHKRDLNHDWFHDDDRLIEVEMTQNQFAEFITSLNYGSGVPCTIRNVGDGIIQEPPYISKVQLFQEEFKNKMHNIGVDLKMIVSGAIQTLKSKDSINKKDREEIIRQIEMLIQDVQKNIPYVSGQFIEQMDKTVTEAKAEVEAFINHKIQTTGIEALKAGFTAPELPLKSEGVLGDDGVRDPDNPCTSFQRGKPETGRGFNHCDGDGHYLCKECVHLSDQTEQ